MCSHQPLSLISWEGQSECYCLSTSGLLCVIACFHGQRKPSGREAGASEVGGHEIPTKVTGKLQGRPTGYVWKFALMRACVGFVIQQLMLELG